MSLYIQTCVRVLTFGCSRWVAAHEAGGLATEPVRVTLAASPNELLAAAALRVEAPATEVAGAWTLLDGQVALI